MSSDSSISHVPAAAPAPAGSVLGSGEVAPLKRFEIVQRTAADRLDGLAALLRSVTHQKVPSAGKNAAIEHRGRARKARIVGGVVLQRDLERSRVPKSRARKVFSAWLKTSP